MKDYYPPQDLLKERVILVTGAGQGIGRTAALSFAAHGATVILHGRSLKNLEAVYDEIMTAGHPQPAIFPLDLEKAEDKDYAALAEAIKQQLGRLDGILHNAARSDNLRPLELHTLEHWLATLRVNLAAPFALTRACLPLLRAAPDASIIMTSDTRGHEPAAYWGAYGVAKCALEGLVKIWAQELELYPSLRINTLIPGAVQSPQRARTHPGEIKSGLPGPEALMPLYLYLMGQDSRGLSGQVFAG